RPTCTERDRLPRHAADALDPGLAVRAVAVTPDRRHAHAVAVTPDRLHVWAGGGIARGSDPLVDQAEAAPKARPVQGALTAAARGPGRSLV
ncbi:MAG TPA: hypothetical protein VGJ54_14190, partial [Streptosporangiaceae bacterium]